MKIKNKDLYSFIRIYFCKTQLFFHLSSVFCARSNAAAKTSVHRLSHSHNYITRACLKPAQITLHMNGCFHSTRLISGGSELHMKVINGVSFSKSTLRRPEWMTTPDKVKQTPWPIRFNPQSYWNSHTVTHKHTHTGRLHTHDFWSTLSHHVPLSVNGRIQCYFI